MECSFSMRIKHDIIKISYYYKLNDLIPLYSSFLFFFSSNPAGHIPGVEYHSSSNKAWKFVGIVLVLLLVIAIVLMICMYYKYRKVSNALLVVVRENADYEVRGGHGVAANNGNVVEMKDTNIGQKVNTVAVPDVEDDDDDDDDDNDDDDDEEMLNP